MRPRPIIYYDHASPNATQPGFRSGEAGLVHPDPDGGFQSEADVPIGPNSLHALVHHGVAEALRRLPYALGPMKPGRDAIIQPTALDAAASLLYEADRMTYGRTWEFVVWGGTADDRIPDPEYRIVIDNREYQRTLARLQFLVTTASHRGLGVRFKL
jgi:hypothetical protein